MRKFLLHTRCVVLGIGLLSATQAVADPLTVTSGLVTAQQSGGTFSLRGDGFSLSGAPPFGYVSTFWDCTPCQASDRLTLSLSSSTSGTFDDLPGEFNHQQYDATYLAGHLTFTAGDMTSAVLQPGLTSISMPFTFSGELANFETFAGRTTPGTLPLFIATFTGSGIATARFRIADADGALFFADSITYEFASATPTPEPTSLLLIGSGAALLLGRRRVRRSREG
jgi:hypothetical protein